MQGYLMKYFNAVKAVFVRGKALIGGGGSPPTDSTNVWESAKTYKHPERLGVGVGKICLRIYPDGKRSYHFSCSLFRNCGKSFSCIYGESCEILKNNNFPPIQIPCSQNWAAKIHAQETHPEERMPAKTCPVCGSEIPASKEVCPSCLRVESATLGDLETRTLCSDGSCIGIIGTDGRCNVCGKVKS